MSVDDELVLAMIGRGLTAALQIETPDDLKALGTSPQDQDVIVAFLASGRRPDLFEQALPMVNRCGSHGHAVLDYLALRAPNQVVRQAAAQYREKRRNTNGCRGPMPYDG